jgi:hypothetical protein
LRLRISTHGVAEGQRHDPGVLDLEERRRDAWLDAEAAPEGAPDDDRPARDGRVEKRLTRKPAQRVLVSDEIGGPADLVARLDPKDVLVDTRQRAPIRLGSPGRECHQAPHDLVRVALREEIGLDRFPVLTHVQSIPCATVLKYPPTSPNYQFT